MSIGSFSLSLAVKDLAVSKEFYEKLGFAVTGGDMEQNWLIMRNDDCTIGLFQGMFPTNTLTFNPGWNAKAEEINLFKDVRVIQEELRDKGIEIIESADPQTTGAAHIFLFDPDGNPILIDQHR
jgi:catechol 2,3-dioxygenase-like lactoylglutathione lyase family enzyme